MIKTYAYIETSHSKLHEFVMAFFDRIEFETGDFNANFYIKEFWDNVVSHHPRILDKRFKEIYEYLRGLHQGPRSAFIEAIRASNNIEGICLGKTTPMKDKSIPKDIRDVTKKLFDSLYNTVLKSTMYFGATYGLLKNHYIAFQEYKNNKLEYCPSCGIWEMKGAIEGRDEYDHYLPKEDYPFSSVNFKNLIPICGECNTFEVKSNKDILKYTGVVFYPFDEKHKGIDIEVKRLKEDPNSISKTTWQIKCTNKDGKSKEIEAWKKIYEIDDRYTKHIIGHIDTWYSKYDSFMTDSDSIANTPDDTQRSKSYLISRKNGKQLEYVVLTELVKSFDARARTAAKTYSRY